MSTICHVFDETADWQQRLGVGQLLDRVPGDRYSQKIASIDSAALRELNGLPPSIELVPRIAGVNLFAAPLLGRLFDRNRVALVHAWGPSAAAAASSASQRPVVVELFDPNIAVRGAKMLRAIARPEGFAILCSTQWIRRRLIENGVPAENCVVIRPGIDFACIQKIRKSSLRTELGISENDFVIVLPEAQSPNGSSFWPFWAGALLNHLEGQFKVIVPGSNSTVRRIERFASTLHTSTTLIAPGKTVSIEKLISIADALVISDTGDVSTTAIAWAMGAGVAVIAAAGYAVTEFIVTGVNGLLYKHPEDKPPTPRIIALLRDRESQRKVREAARGQAYEVFSLRRYVEQHVQLYENVLNRVSPSQGITDSAQVG